jgi:hypothetical protein
MGTWRYACFNALFQPLQLVLPEALEGCGPFVERANGLGIGTIEHLAALAANVDQTDVLEDTKVFRDGGLLKAEGVHDIGDGAFLKGEEVAAAGLGDSIKGVGGSGGTSHGKTMHSHMGMCQAELVRTGAFWCGFP